MRHYGWVFLFSPSEMNERVAESEKKKLVVIHPGTSARACKGQPSSIGREEGHNASEQTHVIPRMEEEGGGEGGREGESV